MPTYSIKISFERLILSNIHFERKNAVLGIVLNFTTNAERNTKCIFNYDFLLGCSSIGNWSTDKQNHGSSGKATIIPRSVDGYEFTHPGFI